MIYAMSRDKAIGFTSGKPYIVISIGTSADRPQFADHPNHLAVEHFTFFDINEAPRTLQQRDAERLWAFVCRYWDQVSVVVCHCDHGMSRSPAVAAAIMRAKGSVDAEWFRRGSPNLAVYDRMLEAAGVIEAPKWRPANRR
jgi:predicted protein tyrosine phosphatase